MRLLERTRNAVVFVSVRATGDFAHRLRLSSPGGFCHVLLGSFSALHRARLCCCCVKCSTATKTKQSDLQAGTV